MSKEIKYAQAGGYKEQGLLLSKLILKAKFDQTVPFLSKKHHRTCRGKLPLKAFGRNPAQPGLADIRLMGKLMVSQKLRGLFLAHVVVE